MTLILTSGVSSLDLAQTQVMGILNVTPDSFSDGGNFLSAEKAIERAHEMLAEGASIIDIGGESTRPGAAPVSEAEELDRVLPVIEVLPASVLVSIDTSKPSVMSAAVKAGACLINDVRALREEGAIEAVSELDVPVCMMHMQGDPRTMQNQPQYENVVEEIKAFFRDRIQLCKEAGISNNRIIIDPGIGFGKTLDQNLSILKNLTEFSKMEFPVLLGVSRKSMLGTLLDQSVDQRLFGSIALASAACLAGVAIIRAHDVKATCEAIKVCQAVVNAK